MVKNDIHEKDVAILLLAGSGTRIYQDIQIKKQFYPINHKELYLYALETFLKSNLFQRIVLVIDGEDQERIAMNLKNKVDIPEDTEIALVYGGKDRNESVYHGLVSLKDIGKDCAVFIHDAARPLLEEEELFTLHKEIREHDALTLMLPMHDSILREKNGKLTYVDRKNMYRVLTPQVFIYSKILSIYENGYDKKDTDDFKKAVDANLDCKLVRGNVENFKVTEIDDLKLLEHLIIDKGC
jgi:2-C-methyl-D-erythritol 4-phosphate cytidylyltransferase